MNEEDGTITVQKEDIFSEELDKNYRPSPQKILAISQVANDQI